MSRPRLVVLLRWVTFAALLLVAGNVREYPGSAIDMAIVWLPSGIAVAGVYLLGMSSASAIVAAVLLQRLWLDYDVGVALSGAAGSACEAILGTLILRRFDVQRPFSRVNDVGAVMVAAMLAPFGSILFSWLGRSWLWSVPGMPFYSGWDGWWRMNALGIVMVVPVALTWRDVPRDQLTLRAVGAIVAGTAAAAALLLGLLEMLPHGAVGVQWLNLVLVGVAVLATARFGMRGATYGTVLFGLVVVVATTAGLGPFIGLARGERHVALQLFQLALCALPPTFAAVVDSRRSAEAAGRRTEALLASINRNVQEGLFRADPDLRLVYGNLALARMFGHERPEALLNQSLADAFAEAERRTELLSRLQADDQVSNEEVRLKRADGSTFWGLMSGVATRDASGVITHYDGAIADITTRKALEERYREAQKMEAVGRLAGGVAHDFNNLLTVIMGYAEVLRDEARPGDRVFTHAQAVHEAGTRAARLTRQLLAYSRRQVLTPRVVDLSEVVDQMVSMLHRLVDESIRVVVKHPSGPCWVRVDRSQLEQVVLNLVVNGRDAMPRGGTLTISTRLVEIGEAEAAAHPERTAGPCAMLCVHDTGVGMAPDVLAHAFDPFFTTKEQGRGTGLGLATVYGIVRQSGGSAWLESAPGEGTRACVTLPRWNAPDDVEEPQATSPAVSATARVLIVEDEPALRALVRHALEARGYQVLDASNGARALEVADAADGLIDLVVTDVVMPVMGGRDLASRMRARWPRMRFLFVSGYPEGAGTADDLSGDGNEFLGKPFSPDELLARVEQLLNRGTSDG